MPTAGGPAEETFTVAGADNGLSGCAESYVLRTASRPPDPAFRLPFSSASPFSGGPLLQGSLVAARSFGFFVQPNSQIGSKTIRKRPARVGRSRALPTTGMQVLPLEVRRWLPDSSVDRRVRKPEAAGCQAYAPLRPAWGSPPVSPASAHRSPSAVVPGWLANAPSGNP